MFRRDQVWAATGEHCSQSHCSQQTHICKCKIFSSSYILTFATKCPKNIFCHIGYEIQKVHILQWKKYVEKTIS